MRDGALIGRHHVHAAGAGGADVRDRRLARRWIEGSQLHGNVGARGIQEGFDGFRPRAHRRVLGQAAGIHRGAVPQRVDAGDGERKLPALQPQEPRQRAPHIAIPDKCQLH